VDYELVLSKMRRGVEYEYWFIVNRAAGTVRREHWRGGQLAASYPPLPARQAWKRWKMLIRRQGYTYVNHGELVRAGHARPLEPLYGARQVLANRWPRPRKTS
jgi:hypothetical protein